MENMEPKFPAGTPEYEQYHAELREELGKFARGENPYPYPQMCRAKLGGPHRMHECGKQCVFLTLGEATDQRRGSYSGWYHVDPALDATHWPVPASAL